ncbi:hypothetical protein MRX96_007115 [Rhipicephalus microplus]
MAGPVNVTRQADGREESCGGPRLTYLICNLLFLFRRRESSVRATESSVKARLSAVLREGRRAGPTKKVAEGTAVASQRRAGVRQRSATRALLSGPSQHVHWSAIVKGTQETLAQVQGVSGRGAVTHVFSCQRAAPFEP